jgi:HAD superfamily hydrolase (TIGR01509 family)
MNRKGVGVPELKALLFDVDGTLADTERDGHRLAFNRAFADAGLDWDWSVERYGALLWVTGGKERIRYYLDTMRPDFKRPARLDEFVAGLHKAKTQHYNRLLDDGGIPFRPGVRRLLGEAREAGLRLAIATTTSPENVTTLLNSNLGDDAEHWFEIIAAGDIVPAKKPAPDIYRYVLTQMRLRAKACIAFEDSENGVRASCGANLLTVITTNDYTATQDFNGAALVLDQLGEPDKPFKVLRGSIGQHHYISVTALNELFQRNLPS